MIESSNGSQGIRHFVEKSRNAESKKVSIDYEYGRDIIIVLLVEGKHLGHTISFPTETSLDVVKGLKGHRREFLGSSAIFGDWTLCSPAA